ncbi:MAG: hypothetical protein ACM35G_10185, partial [Planctomycetaceae bacterium]
MIRTGVRALAVVLAFGWVAIAAEIPKPEHPAPDSVRAHWLDLNGPWRFRLDPRRRRPQGAVVRARRPGVRPDDRRPV